MHENSWIKMNDYYKKALKELLYNLKYRALNLTFISLENDFWRALASFKSCWTNEKVKFESKIDQKYKKSSSDTTNNVHVSLCNERIHWEISLDF